MLKNISLLVITYILTRFSFWQFGFSPSRDMPGFYGEMLDFCIWIAVYLGVSTIASKIKTRGQNGGSDLAD